MKALSVWGYWVLLAPHRQVPARRNLAALTLPKSVKVPFPAELNLLLHHLKNV